MKHKLLVLADDLTGALDTGVQSAKKNIDVKVYLSPQPADMQDENAAVTVINTGSRHISGEAAREITGKIVKSHKNHSFFYKKTDSCLRGNIGAELEALAEAAESQCLPFVPAYPEIRRYTRNGTQYLNEKPIHESSMANDPLNRITESFIPAIIGKQSAMHVRLIPINGSIQPMEQKPEILVFDSEKRDDLANIARNLKELGLLKTTAGCAGFAEALMEILPLERQEKKHKKLIVPLPILIVTGSLHPVSVNQARTAIRYEIPGIGFNADKAVNGCWPDSADALKLTANCIETLLKKGICILGTDSAIGAGCENTVLCDPKGILSRENVSLNLPDVIGKLVKKIIQAAGPLHLAVFGGDTLLGIVQNLGYNCLKPVQEIKPGIVLAEVLDCDNKGCLVTKAGAFGEENLILTIRDFLSGGINHG